MFHTLTAYDANKRTFIQQPINVVETSAMDPI